MKKIYIYAPQNVVEMSIALMKDLCWVSASYALQSGFVAPRYKAVKECQDAKDCVKLVSLEPGGVSSFSGNHISTDLCLDAAVEAEVPDAILLGAFWGQTEAILLQNRALLPWLRRSHEKGVAIAAVSNAPTFLAEAGLLDGKVATVYPPSADAFRARYPHVFLKEERAITDAGNVYCANGIASGCDLIVSVIELVYGPQIARRISQEFLLGFNRSYTLANVSFDGQKYHQDTPVLSAQQMFERNFSESISVHSVAVAVGMSVRNFSRRFKQATGDSPSVYIQRVRIEAAKELLKTSGMTVSEIAYRTGFSDASHLGRKFMKQEGCQPHVYREKISS